jgi:formate dehydrogenase subunit delta
VPDTLTEADRQAHLPPAVRLANELARQFPQVPEEEAAATVAAHIRRYWDPRMRESLHRELDAGGADLLPVARAAAVLLRDR